MKGYAKNTSFRFFGSVLAVALAAQSADEYVGWAGGNIITVFWGGLQMWVIYMTGKHVWRCSCCRVQDDAAAPSSGAAPQRKAERLPYLDNLKVFLTVIVIMHHQSCAFVGGEGWYFGLANYEDNPVRPYLNSFLIMNQSYFMCMFFFVSGLFTPRSFAKRGRAAFLADKFRRLGVPFLGFSFGLVFLLNSLVRALSGHMELLGEGLDFVPQPGPLWFVGWLLIFNSAYAATDHTHPTALPFPPAFFPWLLKWCTALVLANAAVMAALESQPSFFNMPITFGSLPGDIFFFFGGCVAANNGWLSSDREVSTAGNGGGGSGDGDGGGGGAVSGARSHRPGSLPEYMDANRRWLRACWLAAAAAWLSVTLSPPAWWPAALGVLPLHVLCAPWMALTFPVQLDFFRCHFNWSGPWSARLAGAAYTAYIVHPLVVVLSTAAFARVYNSVAGAGAGGAAAIVWDIASNASGSPDGRFSTTRLQDGAAWLSAGVAATCIVSVLVTFLVSHLIREYVPGAKSIL
jgi:fucose 4-O-acetylase-like acetyltransferase